MSPKTNNRTVAVIGAGPSGLSAVKALDEEKVFSTIRVFERRDKVGGTWYAHLYNRLFTLSSWILIV
jgi:cation diffusion facilitator CzcD-associated flavoprotein CzcO